MNKNKQKTWLVQTGKIMVELESSGLSYDDAVNLITELEDKGYSDVKMREEDPNHPTWPKHMDDMETETTK